MKRAGTGRRTASVPFSAGRRIKDLREARGLSRRDLARALGVDLSSVRNWEAGENKPRIETRAKLARFFGCDLDAPYAAADGGPVSAHLVDTLDELPGLLMDLTGRTRGKLRALRLSAPYPTTAYVQVEWRTLLSARLLDGSLTVQRIEIFYDLRRLQETLSNIFRYEGHNYHVKSCCAGVDEVVPAYGGYMFDDDEFLIGAYWSSVPPDNQKGIRVSGRPFREYFNAYWDEIWRRGTWLNMRGPHDLSALRHVALKLGLPAKKWPAFVKGAKTLAIGDGAPPLI